MKRRVIVVFAIIIFVVLAVVIFFFSTHKSLQCTKVESSTGMVIESEYVNSFVRDEMRSVQYTIQLKLNSNYIRYKKTIEESLNKQYSKYKKYKGITYDISHSDEVIRLHMNIDVKSLSRDVLKELELTDSTFKARKKSLEDLGYTCK